MTEPRTKPLSLTGYHGDLRSLHDRATLAEEEREGGRERERKQRRERKGVVRVRIERKEAGKIHHMANRGERKWAREM